MAMIAARNKLQGVESAAPAIASTASPASPAAQPTASVEANLFQKIASLSLPADEQLEEKKAGRLTRFREASEIIKGELPESVATLGDALRNIKIYFDKNQDVDVFEQCKAVYIAVNQRPELYPHLQPHDIALATRTLFSAHETALASKKKRGSSSGAPSTNTSTADMMSYLSDMGLDTMEI